MLSLRADLVEIKRDFVQVHEALRKNLALNGLRLEQASQIDTNLDGRYTKLLERYNSDVWHQYNETVDQINSLLKKGEDSSAV